MYFKNKHIGNTTENEMITLHNGTTISPGANGLSPNMVRWIGIEFERKMDFKHHVMLKAASGKRAHGSHTLTANTES
jgi:hypothetical protein